MSSKAELYKDAFGGRDAVDSIVHIVDTINLTLVLLVE